MTDLKGSTVSVDSGEVAVLYASAGWAVFPIWWTTPDGRCGCPGGSAPETSKHFCGRTSGGLVVGSPGKHPIGTVALKGVNDASRDPQVVSDWFRRYPRAYVGLPAARNQLVVVDVDLDKAGTLDNFIRLNTWAKGRGVDLTATLAADTGGGGNHYFFAAPQGVHAASCKDSECAGCVRNGQGNKPPFGPSMTGIDLRGSGGYVVAAPSGHVSGNRYRWINPNAEPAPWPEILSNLMELAARPATPVIRRSIRTGNINRYGEVALNKELDTLRGQKQGGRNGALNRASFNLGSLVGAGVLPEQTVRDELLSVALAIGLTEAESLKSIESGLTAGMRQPRKVPA